MRRVILVAMLAGVCARADAQQEGEARFGSEAGEVLSGSVEAGRKLGVELAVNNEQAEPARLIERVLTAMNDAPGTGEEIVRWLRARRAVVEPSPLAAQGASSRAWLRDAEGGPGRPAIYLAPRLLKASASYRLLAALIAREASELMLEDFPESAEKRYIAASRCAEAYFELGGTRIALPALVGTVDEDLAATIRVWVENAAGPGVRCYKARGSKTLGDVEAGLLAELDRLGRLEQAIEQMLSVTPWEDRLRDELRGTRERSREAARRLEAVGRAQEQFRRFQEQEDAWLMTHRPS